MTVEELTDEISAIEAIYPESVTNLGPQLYTFKIPNHESVSIQLNFPLTYPEEIPQLLQIIVEKTTHQLMRNNPNKLHQLSSMMMCIKN